MLKIFIINQIEWLKKNKLTIFYYFISLVLTILILGWLTEFHKINWEIPIWYGGDTLWLLIIIKSLINNEWSPFANVKSDYLSAPYSFNMGDFPATENLFFGIFKSLDVFFNDPIVIYNIYIILTFIFTTLIFIYAIRQLKVKYPIAIVFGIIFSFLPYHILRGGHLGLASYFILPLLIVILTWIWNKKPIFFKKNSYKIDILNFKSIFTIISIILGASMGVYYSFFFCFFALVAGISAFFYHKKSIRHFLIAILIIFLTAGMLFINLLPNKIYQIKNGNNEQVGTRHPLESEIYGLKLTNILLPLSNHRISRIQRYAKKYYSYNNPGIEGSNEYIGAIAILGLLILIIRLLIINKKSKIYDRYGPLVISGFLLATIGGFGSIFALIISPNIRGYNRISIFLAAFGIFTVALITNKYSKYIKNHFLLYLLLFIILTFGIIDQTTIHMKFSQPYTEEAISDKNFIKKIENTVPPESMIFQLPYAPFPEIPPINNMADYSHFKGYLNSNTLKWSYGAVKGRPESLWQEGISSLPFDEMIQKIAITDFAGIYIDRFGYADNGAETEAKLSELLNTKPIVSKNERLSFFNLLQFKSDLFKKLSKEEIKNIKQKNQIIESWKGSCSTLETDGETNWRWCGNNAELIFYNFSQKERTVKIETSIVSPFTEISNLIISSSILNKNLKLNNKGIKLKEKLIIPPGKTVINIKSDGKKMIVKNDPRDFVIRIFNFTFNYE